MYTNVALDYPLIEQRVRRDVSRLERRLRIVRVNTLLIARVAERTGTIKWARHQKSSLHAKQTRAHERLLRALKSGASIAVSLGRHPYIQFNFVHCATDDVLKSCENCWLHLAELEASLKKQKSEIADLRKILETGA